MLPPLENSPSAAAPSTPSTSLTSQLKEGGALKDLIDTEDTYVDLLAGIIRKVAGAWSRSNLPPPELDTMFRSIEGIYKANRTFRSRMKDIGNNYPAPKPIGNLLIRWIEDLDAPYTTYCTNYRYGFDTWDPVRSNAKLAKVLKNFSESSSTPPPPSATTSVPLIPLTWTLDELFLLPSARLRYYRKLYSRLLQKTVHGRTDHELLVGAVDTFDRLLNTLNGRRRIRVGETPTSLTPTISETGTMREGDLHSDWPSPTEWSRAATPPIEAAGCSFEFVQDELRNSTLPPTAPAVDTKMPDTSAEVECLVLTLEVLFADREKYRQLLSCRGSSAQRLLDMFQRLLDTLTKPLPTFRSELIVATQRLAGQSGLYPACYEIDNITTIGDYFESSGAFADIYRGTFRGQAVCLKIIRLDMKTEKQQFLKVCSKEAILWGQLSHPSLLLFYGIYRLRNRICFVSPWMEHGDINNYLWNHPSVNRILLVFDIARGLLFLHENKIVHGDLKGPNILVDRSGIACVADFGLSSVSDPYGGSVRWQAPELFDPDEEEDARNTKASDVYAFSCVLYEIFTGHTPFWHLSRDTAVSLKVRQGDRPARPATESPSWSAWGLTEQIWSLIQDCWKADPAARPTIEQIILQLAPKLSQDSRVDGRQGTLSPAQFREMTRERMIHDEMSVHALASLLRPA